MEHRVRTDHDRLARFSHPTRAFSDDQNMQPYIDHHHLSLRPSPSRSPRAPPVCLSLCLPSGVDDMSGLFSSTHCSNAAFNSDISDWDVSSVTTFEGMFEGATSFNQDLSGWDTSSATNMDSMFKVG